MKKNLGVVLMFSLFCISSTVHGDVYPSTWTGYIYVEGDGAGGVDTVPSGLAAIEGLELSFGAILNQATDLTIDASADESVKVGIAGDSALSIYNISGGTLDINGTSLLVGYGTSSQGTINQTGGTVSVSMNTVIGFGDGAAGTYSISGADSTCETGWTILGERVGSSGALTVENGATYRSQVNDGWGSGPVTVGFDGGTGTLAVNTGGTLEATELFIGRTGLWNEDNSGTGTGTLGEGTITIDGPVWIGYKGTSSGTFTQTGGDFTCNGQMWIGHRGTASSGQYIQTGGTAIIHDASIIGIGEGSQGSYSISGADTLCEANWTIVGEAGATSSLTIENGATYRASYEGGHYNEGPVSIGFNGGTGTLTVATGGTLETNKLLIGHTGKYGGAAGNGTATLSEGAITLTGENFYIGFNNDNVSVDPSTGIFTQTGGTVDLVSYNTEISETVTEDLVLGHAATGTYDMQSGSFLGDSTVLGEAGGSGTLNISGDASFVTNDITIGLDTGTGDLNLSGGALNTGSILLGNTGTFSFTGGTLSADAVSGILVDQQGGVVSPGDSPGISAFDTGYTMQAGSYLVEINGVDQGDAANSNGVGYDWIDVTGVASLDGIVEVDLLNGFAPAANDSFDILTATEGISLGETFSFDLDNAVLSEGWTWTYSVVDLDGTAQALRLIAESTNPQIPGDANKDGKVDGSDVTILAGNWQAGVDGTPGVTWEMGDFNGDGKVDGSDVTILAGNWQYGVESAASAVPEPSVLILLLGLVASVLVFRRR